MPKKSPNDLEAGMILAADVSNLDGQTLFKMGLHITQRHIDILQMWGIPNVEVEGEEEAEDPLDLNRFSPHVIAKAERLVGPRFRNVKSSHPAIDVIRAVCVLEAAKAIGQEEGER